MSVIQDLKEQISILQEKIGEIQNQCSHPTSALTKKYGANTGNYDPSADCYWTDFECGLCEKFWTEEGSK